MKRHSARIWAPCLACILCCCTIIATAAERDALAKKFQSYDSDNNGRVTPDELPAPQAFEVLDRNADGAITLKETRAAVAAGLLRDLKLPPPGSKKEHAAKQPAANQQASESNVADWSDEVRQAATPLKAGELGIGKRVDDLEFFDIEGNRHRLSDFQDAKAVVIAMTGTGCPLCLKYAPSLAAIEDRYRDKQVAFVWVNPNESESLSRVRKAIDGQGFDGPYIRDVEEDITGSLGVKTTTEVFVIDAARTLCYRGAVDDQYGFGYGLDSPRKNYLTDALDAVIDGERPLVSATSSPGCEMFYSRDFEPVEQMPNANTYHNRISRILMNHCVDCHREGGSAPFALQDYGSVRDYSQMIASVVGRGIMPPWFASEHGGRKLHWSNDPSLSEADRNDLLAWIDEGAAEGNPSDGPVSRSYPDEWEIGEPDLQLQIPKPIAVKREGLMPYKRTTIKTKLSEDRWVQAVEIRPTDPSVVHHVLVFVKEPGKDVDTDEEAGFFAAYVPGNTFQIYPEGFAKKLPAGSELECQLHYTPNGTATSDQTRVGIRFAAGPPKRIVRNTGIANHKIKIPAEASNHEEQAFQPVPRNVRLLSFMPHMHLRGKAFRYTVTYPNGDSNVLLDVPRYDFNWQLEYRLSEPLDVPVGSEIKVEAWYDNSPSNPAIRPPYVEVDWGRQTDDEMMIGYVEYVYRDEVIGESSD